LIYQGVVEPIPIGQSAKDYLEQNVNKTLIKALTALCKEKPKDPVVSFDLIIKIIIYNICFFSFIVMVSG
jgi:hypothetical protein